jgi:hypothetical protein
MGKYQLCCCASILSVINLMSPLSLRGVLSTSSFDTQMPFTFHAVADNNVTPAASALTLISVLPPPVAARVLSFVFVAIFFPEVAPLNGCGTGTSFFKQQRASGPNCFCTPGATYVHDRHFKSAAHTASHPFAVPLAPKVLLIE